MYWIKTTTFLSAALLLTGGWGHASAAQSALQLAQASSPANSTLNRKVTYANGVYTARGWYGGLPSSITVTVTVTLDRGVITKVNVQTHATDSTSLGYQRRFAAVPGVVVGKPIGEVKVDKLAGPSGTPDGFNDALRKIRAEAKKVASQGAR